MDTRCKRKPSAKKKAEKKGRRVFRLKSQVQAEKTKVHGEGDDNDAGSGAAAAPTINGTAAGGGAAAISSGFGGCVGGGGDGGSGEEDSDCDDYDATRSSGAATGSYQQVRCSCVG